MAKEKQKISLPVRQAGAQSKTVSAQSSKGGSVLGGQEKATFAFGKDNYKMMLVGIALVAIGMLLMVGGASDDPNKMSEEIFDFQRLTLAPIIIIGGYVVVLLAIIKKPKE